MSNITNFVVIYETNKIGFLKKFDITYKFDNINIIKADILSNNFASNSILINIKKVENDNITFEVKSFELSNFTIPSLYLTIKDSDRMTNIVISPQTISYNPVSIKVTNKQPIENIYSFIDPLWFIIPSIIILLSIAGFLIFKNKKKEKERKEEEKSLINPFELFQEKLLEIKNLDFDKNKKEIFIKISEELRRFLENILKFNALEMGSREILNHLKRLKDLKDKDEIIEIIGHVLKICDRVKFAKHIPSIDEKENCITECENLLKILKPEEEL